MIDHMDKQTQPMDLEPKRGRGRPATGQALSNADRQRAYRERQKAQRNEKNNAPEWNDVRNLTKKIDEQAQQIQALEQQLVQQREEYNDLVHKLMVERDQLKSDLATKPRRHRDQPAAELPESAYSDDQEKWAVYGKTNSKAKNWKRLTPAGSEYASEREAMDQGIYETPSIGKNALYTAFKVT
ncbi:hypothetical protein HBO32_31430 [Pseudomonas nitroreducens]|uniref:hypothetical protein n=1 Tax=Pseudomonas nitroreducens TaxID=46680 RepID=UPI001472D77D|nr:hypothetical protein [Pseudomonas nitroreducens]NMZ77613.1 hypothetical protein [Pseudomonas nitroreducens]